MDDFKQALRFGVTAKQTAEIVRLQEEGVINKRGAQEVAKHLRQQNGTIIAAITKAMIEEELDTLESVQARVRELLNRE